MLLNIDLCMLSVHRRKGANSSFSTRTKSIGKQGIGQRSRKLLDIYLVMQSYDTSIPTQNTNQKVPRGADSYSSSNRNIITVLPKIFYLKRNINNQMLTLEECDADLQVIQKISAYFIHVFTCIKFTSPETLLIIYATRKG